MTLCAQKLKMRWARKPDAAAGCAKLKAMLKLTAIDLYLLLYLSLSSSYLSSKTQNNKLHNVMILSFNLCGYEI
jgi:hypothetical protein